MANPEEIPLDVWRRAQGQKKRRPRIAATEAQEQAALVAWRDTVVGQEPRLRWLFHVPNGEYRPKGTARKLKAMGTARGVPDLWLPVGAMGYVGLVIELKAQGGATSEEQDDWVLHLVSQGWRAQVCMGWVEAARTLAEYLSRDLAEMGLDKL